MFRFGRTGSNKDGEFLTSAVRQEPKIEEEKKQLEMIREGLGTKEMRVDADGQRHRFSYFIPMDRKMVGWLKWYSKRQNIKDELTAVVEGALLNKGSKPVEGKYDTVYPRVDVIRSKRLKPGTVLISFGSPLIDKKDGDGWESKVRRVTLEAASLLMARLNAGPFKIRFVAEDLATSEEVEGIMNDRTDETAQLECIPLFPMEGQASRSSG